MPNLRTSVALATYNGERFLRQQLESYRVQSRLPDELCISDDGSSDATVDMVKAFAATAPFTVKLLSNPSCGGVNKNFENAVLHCTGDMILFSDQDDVWLPRHVEDLVIPAESNSEILVVASDSEFVDESLLSMGCTQSEANRFAPRLREATMRFPRNQLELVLRHNMHNGHGMAFRRTLLPLLIPFSGILVYDEWVLILGAAAGRIAYVPRSTTLHRQHQQQTVKTRNKDLKLWASHSRNVSAEQERVEEEKWDELLQRVREHHDLVPEFRSAESALGQKHDFVVRRTRTRQRTLPARLAITLHELLLGRYHRFGRGMLTFARDLYGVRQH